MITQSELKRIWHYWPNTGAFTRIARLNNKGSGKIGDVASCRKEGYIVIGMGHELHYAHRLAWLYVTGEWPKGHLEHINGVRHDNRIKNLREKKPQNFQGVRDISDAWINDFIIELCKRHPEAIDWLSDEIPDIIEQIRGQQLQTAPASTS